MRNRSAKSGKYVTRQTVAEKPAETFTQARQETTNVMRLAGKKRPSAAEKLILKMLWELQSHPKFAGKSAQQILDELNAKNKNESSKGDNIK
jgi:hypothetical protein